MKPILSHGLHAGLQVMRHLHCPTALHSEQSLRANSRGDGLQWDLNARSQHWVTLHVSCEGPEAAIVVTVTAGLKSDEQLKLFGHFEYRAAAHFMNEVAARVLKRDK